MNAYICSIDKTSLSTLFCTCRHQVTFLCLNCLSQHMKLEFNHQTLPIGAFPYYQLPGYLERLRERLDVKDQAIAQLRANLSLVDTCLEQLISHVEELIIQLNCFAKETAARLSKLKLRLEQEITQALTEFEATVYEEQPRLRNSLASALRSFVPGSESLHLFTYRLAFLDLNTKLSGLLTYEFKNRTADAPTPVATVVRPSGLFQFCLPSRRWQSLCRLNTDITVSESSASVLLGDGRVFVCGGLTFGGRD